ncbi:MAG: hypothetical protein JSU78_08195 [Deltaproteobacteria bacterium]|jgi:hypothetical protein|nr:MAG: hypothetical protein JSU78_08195 [Deltaproteobacteria bacterium]
MFPFVFEWTWDAGYLIFMGLLYLVLGVIAFGLIYALVKTWLQLRAPHRK